MSSGARRNIFGRAPSAGSHAGGSRAGGSRHDEGGSKIAGSKYGSNGSQNGIYGVGGVYRENKGKRRLAKRKMVIKCPETNMDHWMRHTAQVKASWDVVIQRANFADIGSAIYEKVATFDKLEHLFSFTDRALQGRKFVDMLNSIMQNIESPEKIHQKMVDLAPLHHRRAVSGSHMPLMGPLLISVFATIGGDLFTHEMRVAWEWFWEFMSRSMVMSLEDVGSTLNIVQHSWDDITERHSNDDIGRAIYAELFRTAPALSAQMFQTEKANDMASKMGDTLKLLANDMASKMGDMLGLLVSHADDPAALKQQVMWLGVRPHMMPLMGPILMGALADAAGDN
ncbi:hypothetical protein T484DRAFT_1788375 [Baffinella frigidus]|nr:hypothetical protein T484DRAFT_1788375 [Cryptophyta sp. CCMP2293]